MIPLHSTPGVLPVPRMTAVVVPGAVTNRVKILGRRGGARGVTSSKLGPRRPDRKFARGPTGKRAA